MMGWNQLGFPDPGTESAGRLFCYHDLVMVVVVFVLILVGWFMAVMLFASALMAGQLDLTIKKHETLEIVWTIGPAVFLCVIGFFSLNNLYYMSGSGVSVFSFSAVGHQWYWEYIYEPHSNTNMIPGEAPLSSKLNLLYSEWEQYSANYDCSIMTGSAVSGYDSNNNSKVSQKGPELAKLLAHLVYTISRLDDELNKISVGLSRACELCNAACGDFSKLHALSAMSDFLESLWDLVLKCQGDLIKPFEELIVSSSKECSSVMDEVFNSVLQMDEEAKKEELRYDSYIMAEAQLIDSGEVEFGGFRRGDVSIPCFACCGVKNEVLVSTADVMHSWGVAELGIKIDAVPGRVNSGFITPMTPGYYYGFCYELCGSGHSEMPIAVVVLNMDQYLMTLNYLQQVV
uniref:Cytochrome c oxidase subunit 2 n=1 Tax=Paphia amabilis TaxID=676961 RepID=H6BHS4_9BIVA|nr:cytochrome c oxidase subunit II [Paphia amabilis]AEH99615.1 cytochrome c oxidase subunit II [Paphia amabilis]